MKTALIFLVAVISTTTVFGKTDLLEQIKCRKGFVGYPDYVTSAGSSCTDKHGKGSVCYNLCLWETLGYLSKDDKGTVTGFNKGNIDNVSEAVYSDKTSQEGKTDDFVSCFKSFNKPEHFKFTGKCEQLQDFNQCYEKKLKSSCAMF